MNGDLQRKRWIRILLIAAILLFLIFLYSLRSVLWPFIFAFFIAYIFDPWIEFLSRKGLPRTAAIALVLFLLALTLIITVIWIVPPVAREIAHTVNKFPKYVEVIRNRLTPWIQTYTAEHPDVARQLEDYFNNNIRPKLPLLLNPILDVLLFMFSGFANFIVVMLNLFLVPVLAFYLLKDYPDLKQKFFELIPPRHVPMVQRRLGEADEALSKFLRGQLTVSLILGLIYTIGLLILGVPLAIPVGMFSGLANLVPYLGFILGISISMLLSFVDNQQWQRLVWIVALYAFAQLNEGTWIGPLVVGRRTGLHPVMIMLGLVIGGTLFGFMGMLLAVPVMAVTSVFVKSGYEAYISSQWYLRQKQEPPAVGEK